MIWLTITKIIKYNRCVILFWKNQAKWQKKKLYEGLSSINKTRLEYNMHGVIFVGRKCYCNI